jgi:hypothetical protein
MPRSLHGTRPLPLRPPARGEAPARPNSTQAPDPSAPSAARQQFELSFCLTERGNLSQQIDGTRLTIFKRWGRFHFVVDDGSPSGPRFSPRGGYETEESAMDELWRTWTGAN